MLLYIYKQKSVRARNVRPFFALFSLSFSPFCTFNTHHAYTIYLTLSYSLLGLFCFLRRFFFYMYQCSTQYICRVYVFVSFLLSQILILSHAHYFISFWLYCTLFAIWFFFFVCVYVGISQKTWRRGPTARRPIIGTTTNDMRTRASMSILEARVDQEVHLLKVVF